MYTEWADTLSESHQHEAYRLATQTGHKMDKAFQNLLNESRDERDYQDSDPAYRRHQGIGLESKFESSETASEWRFEQVCLSVYLHVYVYISVYVCMYVRVCVCLCVCLSCFILFMMDIYICTCACTDNVTGQ